MTTTEMKQELDKLNERVKQLETELKKAESEPKFERVAQGEQYYHIGLDWNACVCPLSDIDIYYNKMCYENNNYFHTEERAQEVCDKIKLLLKLERLHDIFCPNYKPSWEDKNTRKYCVYYDNANGVYYIDGCINAMHPSTVYFPTEEIALKICRLLNKELK